MCTGVKPIVLLGEFICGSGKAPTNKLMLNELLPVVKGLHRTTCLIPSINNESEINLDLLYATIRMCIYEVLNLDVTQEQRANFMSSVC